MRKILNRLFAAREHKKRLFVLLVVLACALLGWAAHSARVWYYERQLRQMALAIIEEQNLGDPVPVGPEGPEADVDVAVTCSFAYLVLGEKTGKITLTVTPRPHARARSMHEISFIYTHQDGAWKPVESYVERHLTVR